MSESAIAVVAASERPVAPLGTMSLLAGKYTGPQRFRGDFLSSRLHAKVGSLRVGEVCLDAAQFAVLAGDAEVGDRVPVSFVDLTDILGQGRERSRTKVRFGQLLLDSPSQGPKAAMVAIKYTTPRLAAREFGAMTAFNASALGGDRDVTFRPYGFVPHSDGRRVGLMTDFKMAALTSDIVLWNGPRSERQVAVALSHAAISAADLHINGKAHGDLQPKNVATDNGGIWYTDLEGAQEFVDGRGAYTNSAKGLITDDVRTYLTYRGDGISTDTVAEFFARPYTELMGLSDLPRWALPTLDEVLAIAREPQQPHY